MTGRQHAHVCVVSQAVAEKRILRLLKESSEDDAKVQVFIVTMDSSKCLKVAAGAVQQQ